MRPFFWLDSVFQTVPFGGDEEDRTPDPLRARQVLSQLSYTPIYQGTICLSPSLYPILKIFKTLKIKQYQEQKLVPQYLLLDYCTVSLERR